MKPYKNDTYVGWQLSIAIPESEQMSMGLELGFPSLSDM